MIYQAFAFTCILLKVSMVGPCQSHNFERILIVSKLYVLGQRLCLIDHNNHL